MARPGLGIKRICLSCGAKFYDLDKDPIICPACGAEFDPEAAMKLKRGRVAANDDQSENQADSVKSGDVDDLETNDDIDIDDGDDEGVLEDTSDLEDDDDVPAVIHPEKDDDD